MLGVGSMDFNLESAYELPMTCKKVDMRIEKGNSMMLLRSGWVKRLLNLFLPYNFSTIPSSGSTSQMVTCVFSESVGQSNSVKGT